MSMDKSLKRTSQLVRQRSVLTRAERIARLMAEERWSDASRPLGLPKVKVMRALLKKPKKVKEEAAEGAAVEGAAAAPAAASAAGAKAPAGKAAAGKAPAAKAAAPAAGKGAGKGGK